MTRLTSLDFESPEHKADASPAPRGRFIAAVGLCVFVRPGFNVQMLYGAIGILTVSVLGCKLTHVYVPNATEMLLAFAISAAVILPLALYLRERGRTYFFDLITITYWALFFAYMLFFPVEIAARLGSHIALKDDQLLQIDNALRISVPSIQTWASHNWLGRITSGTYVWLFPFMRAAILIPPLAGRPDGAKKFLTANLVVFALGIPLFAMFPAVGPWYGYHAIVRPDQSAAQVTLFFIRQPGPIQFRIPAGVICFPSFHVVWAILCAYALWSFKFLRIPAATLTSLIILSTLTTGVHYSFDLVGGAVIAILAIYSSNFLSRVPDPSLSLCQEMPWRPAKV